MTPPLLPSDGTLCGHGVRPSLCFFCGGFAPKQASLTPDAAPITRESLPHAELFVDPDDPRANVQVKPLQRGTPDAATLQTLPEAKQKVSARASSDDQQNDGAEELPTHATCLPDGEPQPTQVKSAQLDNGSGLTSAGGESGLPHRTGPTLDKLTLLLRDAVTDMAHRSTMGEEGGWCRRYFDPHKACTCDISERRDALRWLADALPGLINAKQRSEYWKAGLADANAEIETLRAERSQLRARISELPRYRVGLDADDNAEMFREDPKRSGAGDYDWVRSDAVLGALEDPKNPTRPDSVSGGPTE